jgi:phosphate:Na+ symporter
MESTFASWFALPSTQIAMFHTFFNITCTLVFLPFINFFVKASKLIVRDKKKPAVATFIDDRFLNAPSVALAQAGKETLRLGKMSMDALALSIDSFLSKNYDNYEDVKKEISVIEELNQHLLSYLIKVASSEISDENEKFITKLHSMINDFYREAEIADNMMKYTKSVVDNNLRFSDKVCEQIRELKEKLLRQYELVNELYLNKDVNLLNEIDNLEDEIDNMRSIMTEQHIERLENNECSPASSGVFINLVSNLERAGDHLGYIAHAIIE